MRWRLAFGNVPTCRPAAHVPPARLRCCADIPLPPHATVLNDVEEEQKAKEPEKWMELGLQSVG